MRTKLTRSLFPIISVVFIALVTGCSTSTATVPQPVPAQTSPPVTSSPPPSIQLETRVVRLKDTIDDLFDAAGNHIKGETYLDIVYAEITSSDSNYIVRIETKGRLPLENSDPQSYYRWDILVDADNDPMSGMRQPIVTNDLGCEYSARLVLDSGYKAEVFHFYTGKSEKIEYKITENIVELRWPKILNKAETFNFVVGARKYSQGRSLFTLADKIPERWNAKFPDGFKDKEVQTGLPSTVLETDHATVYFNPGN